MARIIGGARGKYKIKFAYGTIGRVESCTRSFVTLRLMCVCVCIYVCVCVCVCAGGQVAVSIYAQRCRGEDITARAPPCLQTTYGNCGHYVYAGNAVRVAL